MRLLTSTLTAEARDGRTERSEGGRGDDRGPARWRLRGRDRLIKPRRRGHDDRRWRTGGRHRPVVEDHLGAEHPDTHGNVTGARLVGEERIIERLRPARLLGVMARERLREVWSERAHLVAVGLRRILAVDDDLQGDRGLLSWYERGRDRPVVFDLPVAAVAGAAVCAGVIVDRLPPAVGVIVNSAELGFVTVVSAGSSTNDVAAAARCAAAGAEQMTPIRPEPTSHRHRAAARPGQPAPDDGPSAPSPPIHAQDTRRLCTRSAARATATAPAATPSAALALRDEQHR